MKIRRSFVFCGLFAIAVIAISAFAGFRFAAAQSDQKDAASRRRPVLAGEPISRSPWEYCVITRAYASPSTTRGSYTLSYLRSGGMAAVSIDEEATNGGALARTISKLGDDGWELVGNGPFEFSQNSGAEGLYFKRPKH